MTKTIRTIIVATLLSVGVVCGAHAAKSAKPASQITKPAPVEEEEVSTVPLEFKGLLVGSQVPIEKIKQVLPMGCAGEKDMCEWERKNIPERFEMSCHDFKDFTSCSGVTTIAGAMADVFTKTQQDGALADITMTIHTNLYSTVMEALVEKYGKPTIVDRGIVSNGFGAQAENVTSIWTRRDSTHLMVTKYAGKLTQSMIVFGTKKEKTKPNTKDL